MSFIKEKQLQILLNLFEMISQNSLLQLAILKQLIETPDSEELFQEALDNEIIIDRLEIQIREEVAFSILKFVPAAEDLRRIISYQDLTTNLERVGDMVLNVIRYVREVDLTRPDMHDVKLLVIQMVEDVTLILRNAVLSFTNEQIEVAYSVLEEDDKVDSEYFMIKDLLSKRYAHKELQSSDIHELLAIECIAHNLERCGDSATNIAESAIYLINGRDVRHVGKAEDNAR